MNHALALVLLLALLLLPSSSFTLRPSAAPHLPVRTSTHLFQSLRTDTTPSSPSYNVGRRFNYRVSHTSVSSVSETTDVRTDDMWYENPVYDRPWDEAEKKVVEEVKKAVFVASTIRDENKINILTMFNQFNVIVLTY
ncbi:hypothetical protein TrLO_g4547 [Triparma laevis f. longispina]|uniref:Uncharacterized protein n=1 Tax=Triparma laevis f. longispina TaxID=1714387 RepID=A0A9W6Z6Y2_9STRA|nr:hypothetical protein TrLO_g4547 [Triparma laevis f. longispina]